METYKTIDDLRRLIGIKENYNLEFKRSPIIEDDFQKFTNSLTKEISAFANTDGGIIVIGIEEERKVAKILDQGISTTMFPPERFQQILESNISPNITGIRFYPIRNLEDENRYYLVIEVPRGDTAYQAKDFVYYVRAEFECKPLRDPDIRFRMFRSKSPTGIVELRNPKKIPANATSSTSYGEYIEYKNSYYYYFDLFLNNTGGVSIKEYKAAWRFNTTDFEERYEDDVRKRDGLYSGSGTGFQSMSDVCVFPEEFVLLKSYNKLFYTLEEFLQKKIQLDWTLYLDNRPAIRGSIMLNEAFKDI